MGNKIRIIQLDYACFMKLCITTYHSSSFFATFVKKLPKAEREKKVSIRKV